MLNRSPSLQTSYGEASAAFRRGRLGEAGNICRAILQKDPLTPNALHLLGLVEANFGRFEKATELFDRALLIDPRSAMILNDRGKALLQLGSLAKAIENFEAAARLRPDFAEAHFNRGSAFVALAATGSSVRHYEAALTAYETAGKIGPDAPQLAINRGNVLTELGQFDAAIAVYDRGLRSFRTSFALHLNRAHALQKMERFEDALEGYDDALAIQPGDAVAHASRGALLLRLGHLAEGWRAYERRPRGTSRTRLPEWDGRAASGMRLLFRAEQGIGDTIQFARFARTVQRLGAEVTIEAPAHLRRLLGTLADVAVQARDGDVGTFDAAADLMSLPARLGIDRGAALSSEAYLSAEPGRIERMAGRLPKGSLNVGIAWQGNPKNTIDRGRSIPLAEFRPLADLPSVRLVSLQKNAGAEQLRDRAVDFPVLTLGDDFDSGPDAFLDTAAAIVGLDLVITSDTAIAHLAGALGKPVWIALQRVPDWRWMIEREDTPWYPTARLFRQRDAGDWAELFGRMKRALGSLAAGAGSDRMKQDEPTTR